MSTLVSGTSTVTLSTSTASARAGGGGGGSGTIGGTIAATQVAFGSAANTIAGDPNLTWDNTAKELGVGCDPNTETDGCVLIGLLGTVTGTPQGDEFALQANADITVNSPNTTATEFAGNFSGVAAHGSGIFASALLGVAGGNTYDGTGTVAEMDAIVAVAPSNTGGGTINVNHGVNGGDQHGVGSTLNAAYFAPNQGTGANDYAIYLLGGKVHNGDYAASSNVCTDSGSNLTTSLCATAGQTNLIDITQAPYNAVGDAVLIPNVSTTSGLPDVTCGACTFTAGMVGKAIQIYNTNNGNILHYTTVATFVSSTHITSTINASITSTTGRAIIGTENQTAISSAITAAIASTVPVTVYAPPGNYMCSGQCVAITGTNPIEFRGAGLKVTNFFHNYFGLGNNNFFTSSNGNTYWHDFSVGFDKAGTNSIPASGSTTDLMNLYGTRISKVGVYNWSAVNNYCMVSNTDAARIDFPIIQNCLNGLNLLWKNITVTDPYITVTSGKGIRFFDFTANVTGGSIGCGSTGGTAISAEVQGTPANYSIMGTTLTAPGCTAFTSTAAASVTTLQGVIITAATGNSTGINIGSTSKVIASGTYIQSSGTGNGINNSGTYEDLGGNVFAATGAANYTGAGTYLKTPEAVGSDVQLAKAAAQTAKTLFTVGTVTAFFRVHISVECTTTSASATVTPAVLYTDTSNTAQTVTGTAATCTALGAASNTSQDVTFRALTATTIQYQTTIVNTPTYDISVTVEQLGIT
jgi:hypothetical protein